MNDASFLTKKSPLIQFLNYKHNARNVRVAFVNKLSPLNQKKSDVPNILFIHGSPGTWKSYTSYLKDDDLSNKARLFSVDRLGFGGSKKGGVETSLAKQASSLQPLLQRIKGKFIVVGHSYGAAVAVKVAMDHPERIGALILIAGAISSKNERLHWYNYLLDNKFMKLILSETILNSNKEILFLKKELSSIDSYWDKLTMPLFVIHGKLDNLVSVTHAYFAKKKLEQKNPKSEFIITEKDGHFIIWANSSLIKKYIIKAVSFF